MRHGIYRGLAMTVAGSDSGGGAGIQADLKTFASLKVFGTSAITAVTVQNSVGVTGIHPVPPEIIKAQILAVGRDFPLDAVKTGMLGNRGAISAVAEGLSELGIKKLVVDPVMVAQSGDSLLEADAVDAVKVFPNPFNPLTDKLPEHIDKEFDRAVAAAKSGNETELIDACHAIERYFNFPKPNELVQKAEIPGGMYTNMVAQLKQLKSESILESAMKLIPRVRLDAGLPPLVTPTSQIVGAQAVNCALDIKNGKPMYSNVSNQFVNLVKGEYGKTPVDVDPEFRLKIAGVREETPYDTSKYKMQPNPVLEEAGGVKLAENEKEVLLLELFPLVAKNYLTGVKKARYQASKPKEEAPAPAAAPAAEAPKAEPAKPAAAPITGNVVTSPMPGRILKVLVAPGDTVSKGQDVVILEAMKMENSIMSDYAGTVKQVLVAEGETVAVDSQLVEIE